MINLEEWKHKLSVPDADVTLDGGDEELMESWNLYDLDVKCKSITIKDTKFSSNVYFNGLSLKGNIIFSNCKIKELHLNNCNLSTNESYKGGLRISDSEITYMLDIAHCKFLHGRISIYRSSIHIFYLINSETGEDIFIEQSPCFHIGFNQVKAKKIEFANIDIKQLPFFYNSEIRLENCHAQELFFYECKLQYVWLSKLYLDNSCLIQKTTISNFNFNEPGIAFDLVCRDSNFTDQFLVSLKASKEDQSGFPMKAIRLMDSDLGKNAMITGSLEKAHLNQLILTGNRETSTSLDIENIAVKYASFSYENTIRTLRLMRIDICTLEIYYLQNSGSIYFSTVRPYGDNTVWSIKHSQTGNWHLNDCSFEGLNYLDISNSDLDGLRYASVVWFKSWTLIPLELREVADPQKQKKHLRKVFWDKFPKSNVYVTVIRRRREVYRMLKEAAENQKDRIQSLRFQQEEMNAYQQELRLTQRFYNPDRIALWAGRSNNHGLNWWKPVGLAIGISLFFYIAIVIGAEASVSWKDIFHSANAWKIIFSEWGLFPQLLNPVHSLEHMVRNPLAIHPLTWYFDYVHRLLMAFFIFQSVAAFRKFIKA